MKTTIIHAKRLTSLLLSLSLILPLLNYHIGLQPVSSISPYGIPYGIYGKPMVDTIWDSIQAGFSLNHQVQKEQVQAEIHALLANKDKLYKILQASAPYIYFIHKEARERGLPAEIALLPVIESEFNPNDHSKKGAAGLWQLMPETAKGLGIKIKTNYDGRHNIVLSTKAALDYLSDLSTMFNGNWYLAISAYNCGQGKIMSAIRHTGNTNIWDLKLPSETKTYLPKLLAIAEIVKHPNRYGIELPPITNTPYFAELKMVKLVSLDRVAEATGVNIRTLYALNPDYKQKNILPNNGVYTLLIPTNQNPKITDKIPFSFKFL
jgi:membrane-bound lytic murein transglycosylase D